MKGRKLIIMACVLTVFLSMISISAQKTINDYEDDLNNKFKEDVTRIGSVLLTDLLLYEGFEDGVMPPPGGWYTEELNPYLGWFIGDQGVYNGYYCGWINFDKTNEKDNWLVSPDINLEGYDSLSLSFWGKSDTNYPGATVEIHIRGNGFDDVVWNLIEDEIWDDFDWYNVNIDLSSYSGNIINISWRYVGLNGESFGLDEIFLSSAENQPPNPPSINGPTNGKVDQTLTYEVSAIDPEGDDVSFWIEWFQGCPGVYWQGPYESGEVVEFNYTWDNQGTFEIIVKAKDTNEAISDISTLSVIIPRIKTIINHPLDDLISGSTNLFSILRILLMGLG